MTSTKQEVISKFQKNTSDTGSTEVQVAIFSSRIIHLTEHLKLHKKDNHTRRGLLNLVSKRRKLLRYLKIEDPKSYLTLIQALNLRS